VLLLVDNYDSFTYNLYQYIRELAPDEEVVVRRNDRLELDEVATLAPSRIVVSPGPRGPADAGRSVEIIRRFGPSIPTLGVCLGHQCIGHAFGGRIVHADRLMHGKTSLVHHSGRGLMAGLPSPFAAVRYHSLTVEPESLPDCLEVTARADDGTIMGLRHRDYPIEGVQFHPESILTLVGKDLLRNFLDLNFDRNPQAGTCGDVGRTTCCGTRSVS
jgi:anthranilate synthase component II